MRPTQDFWSRRKAGVEAEAKALETKPPVEDTRTDNEVLTELNLAAPETLETSDEVKNFLSHELPQRLRARAMRQLWRTNPVFANLDGLVDYGEDFTDAAMVLDKMETVYEVGKGMLTAFVEENTPIAPEAEEVAPADEQEEDTPLIAAAVPQDLPEPETAPIAMPQRRMRFAFQDAS